MVQQTKTFQENLQELREYLAEKNMLAELKRQLGVSGYSHKTSPLVPIQIDPL